MTNCSPLFSLSKPVSATGQIIIFATPLIHVILSKMPSPFTQNSPDHIKSQAQGPKPTSSPPPPAVNCCDLEDQRYDAKSNAIFAQYNKDHYQSWIPVFLVTLTAIILMFMVTFIALQYESNEYDDDKESTFTIDQIVVVVTSEPASITTTTTTSNEGP